jgi:glycosyltransferase involved in cell wall biosynthesis
MTLQQTTSANMQAARAPVKHMSFFRRSRKLKMKLVGVVSPNYGLERVSYLNAVPGYIYCTLRRLPLEKIGLKSSFWQYTPFVLDRSVELIHTFNMLPMNGKFVVSFELELPRYLGNPTPGQMRWGRKIMASDRCRAMLALSEAAANLARGYLTSHNLHEAAEKVKVFRGGLPEVSEVVPRTPPRNRPIKLLFIGRDGLRKGLIPLLLAMDDLRKAKVDVELTAVTVVGRNQSYVFREHTPDIEDWRKRLHATPNVTVHESLPNTQVRQAMRDHDLLVLPTFDESLGWVVAEAGLEGLPSLVTNIFAMPELVEHNITGGLIDLPLSDDRRWIGLGKPSAQLPSLIEQANETIRQGIVRFVSNLRGNPDRLLNLSDAARTKHAAMYSPEVARWKLKEIYDDAIER